MSDAWLGGTGQRQQAGPRKIATKNIEPYLRFFDEAFYLSRYADIRDAVANGGFPSGRYHFETVGFAELRHGFAFDGFWYAGAYPAVANEIAQGNFIDYMHHYVTIGHLIGCSPVRPSAAATGSPNTACYCPTIWIRTRRLNCAGMPAIAGAVTSPAAFVVIRCRATPSVTSWSAHHLRPRLRQV